MPSSSYQGDVPLSLTGHLLHKATTPRPGDITDLPNTHKQIQGGSHNGKTKKHVPPKKNRRNSLKKVNEMEASNLPHTEFTTRVIRMLKNSGEEWRNSVRTSTER